MQSWYSTVWHINRCQKTQKQYPDTHVQSILPVCSKSCLSVEVVKLFQARYKHGYSLMSYWNFVTNQQGVTILLIKLLEPKKVN